MKVFVKGQGTVSLDKRHFVAKGGEGDIYVRGDVAYKLFHDPQKALPASKIRELSLIQDDRVIKPDAVVLARAGGGAIGYAMPFVKHAEPLCRLFPRSFKERHGLDAPAIYRIIEELAARIRSVHAGGALVVDLNEMNFLVQLSTHAVFAIDADSYQTASHPATAILPAIQDPRTTSAPFDELSDWFSFAVLSFQLLVGVHPYKGKHPTVKGLVERMQRGLSVLGQAVKLPPVAYPLDIIPDPWRAWYHAVFENHERHPPPRSMTGAPVVILPAPLTSGPELTTELLLDLASPILCTATVGQHLYFITADGVFMDQRRVFGPVPLGAVLGSTPLGRAVVAWRDGDALTVVDVAGRLKLETAVGAEAITTSGERIYVKSADAISEIVFRDVGNTVITSTRVVARVLPHATRLFDGVAVQSLLGACYVSLFPASGVHLQVRLPELDGLHILEARADGAGDRGVVLIVVARDQGGDDLRLVFRVAPDGSRHDVSTRRLPMPAGVAFAVLDTGLCIAVTEGGELEAFPAAVGAAARRDIYASLSGDVHLTGHHGQLVCARDRRVYRLASHGHTTRQTSRRGNEQGKEAEGVG